jgi:hypothetical protein
LGQKWCRACVDVVRADEKFRSLRSVIPDGTVHVIAGKDRAIVMLRAAGEKKRR